ncbi:MAG: VWA-like domain-containing protein [bacterium]|nr:VWA-like domain-containing protein [bacterium]
MSAKSKEPNPAAEAFRAGYALVKRNAILSPLLERAHLHFDDGYPMAKEDWAWVTSEGDIYANSHRRAAPGEWAYVLAHCLLHLGLGHIREDRDKDPLWNAACDCVTARYLADFHIGTVPGELSAALPSAVREEEQLYYWLKEHKDPAYFQFSTMSGGRADMYWKGEGRSWHWWGGPTDWRQLFAESLRDALRTAVDYAGGVNTEPGEYRKRGPIQRAREWFLASYPLLGGVASGFRLVEDPLAAQRMDISVAAISMRMQEIYVNPNARLTEQEWRFVLAHEYLHAALCHEARLGKRDPELWNTACDYVINQWLRDMEVGTMPEGLLYDPELAGLSAESVYDLLAANLRKYRRMLKHDILFGPPDWQDSRDFVDLDNWCRSAIQRGLDFHQVHDRGYLPAGLVEEIRALSQPPIPWDVKLARWFDERFEPLEKRRTYARLSRRQSATPDIPRPSYRYEEDAQEGRTFGVLLDTSGSMDRGLLAAALGAIASYSAARDVNRVRVVFCDASPYDQGYMEAADIAGSVRVRGRGGTVLQPGVELLERAQDFPKEAPLLVITDCECDRLNLFGRDHAFLVPKGKSLPFPPKGPVFYME